MDVSSMANALRAHDASRRVAGGIGASRGNGMLTAATATTGAGRVLASSVGSHAVASAATGTTAAAAGSASNSNITSSDFLTLLVAEMQNQDPTQPTDPNAYIQQLVGVNSLQQLISINSELGAATGASGGSNPVTPPVTGGVAGGG